MNSFDIYDEKKSNELTYDCGDCFTLLKQTRIFNSCPLYFMFGCAIENDFVIAKWLFLKKIK